MLKNGKNNRCIILTAFGINKSVIKNASISDSDLVIAADGGIDFAIKYNIKVDYLIGDLDSAISIKTTATIIKYKKEKDDTDTMLAIQKGIELGCLEFVILGGIGGRLPHTISNMQLLKYISSENLKGKIISSDCEVLYLENSKTIIPVKCRYFSIITLNDYAHGITIINAKYPLANATLTNSVPLGISNETLEKPVEIEVTNGQLYIVIEKH